MTAPDHASPPVDLPAVLNSLPDAFFTVDEAWRITYVNEHGATFVDQSAAALLGKNLWALFPDLLGTPLETAGRRAMHERLTVDAEGLVPSRNAWLTVRIFPYGDGLGVHFRDVTRGKHDEALRTRLQELVRSLLQAPDMAHVTRLVLQCALDLTGATFGVVTRLRADGENVDVLDALHLSGQADARSRHVHPRERSLVAHAVRTETPVLQSFTALDSARPSAEEGGPAPVLAVAALPLLGETRVIGALLLEYDHAHTFSDAERLVLTDLAAHTAQALERTRALEDERNLRARADLLAYASELLSSSLDPQAVLRDIAHLVVPRLADCCGIFLPNEAGELRPLVVTHEDPAWTARLEAYWRAYPVPLDAPAGVGLAFRTKQATLLPVVDVTPLRAFMPAEQADFIERAQLRSVIDVPLVARGRALGVLELITVGEKRTYTEEDLLVAQDLARRAALALDNAQLHQQTQRELAQREQAERVLGELNATLEERVEDRTYRLIKTSEELAARNRVFEAFTALSREVLVETNAEHLIRSVQRRLLDLLPEATVATYTHASGRWHLRAVDESHASQFIEGVPDPAVERRVATLLRRMLGVGTPLFLEADQVARLRATLPLPAPIGALAVLPVPAVSNETTVLVVGLTRHARWTARDRVVLETAARQLHLALERANALALVQRQREALERRAGELQLLNADLEAFTHSISHDLRAPVRHVLSFSRLLEGRATTLEARDRKFLDTIRRSAERMNEMIEGLLAFARATRQPLTFTLVDLSELVAQVRRDLEPEQDERTVHWQVAPLPCLPGDAATLRIAFTNLLGNALKYTRTVAEARITVRADVTPSEVIVSVEDNGVGFDARYADKLFGVFERLHANTEFEGVGLGLWTVQRIIDRHGGRVWATGAVNRGATFHVALPRQEGRGHDV